MHARSIVRINERIAPAVCTDFVGVQTRSAKTLIAAIIAGAIGLVVGMAMDSPSGVGANMWPVGVIALALIGALFSLIGFAQNHLFIRTDAGLLFTTATPFRGLPGEILAELTPPLDYRMRPRILFRKISWRDYTLWVLRVDADEFVTMAGRSDVA